MTTTATPSVPQMRVRCLSGHISALRRLDAGQDVLPPNATAGTIRGMRTVMGTLLAWGCVNPGTTDSLPTLTGRGRDLLAALGTKR